MPVRMSMNPKRQEVIIVGTDMENKEPLSSVGGNVD